MPTKDTHDPQELKCHRCGSRTVNATGAMQELKTEAGDRLHASLACPSCGNMWWSRHSEALDLARAAKRARQDAADAEPPVEG